MDQNLLTQSMPRCLAYQAGRQRRDSPAQAQAVRSTDQSLCRCFTIGQMQQAEEQGRLLPTKICRVDSLVVCPASYLEVASLVSGVKGNDALGVEWPSVGGSLADHDAFWDKGGAVPGQAKLPMIHLSGKPSARKSQCCISFVSCSFCFLPCSPSSTASA